MDVFGPLRELGSFFRWLVGLDRYTAVVLRHPPTGSPAAR
jgi:hypothetical protein